MRPARQGIAIGVAQVAAELLFPHICTFSIFLNIFIIYLFSLWISSTNSLSCATWVPDDVAFQEEGRGRPVRSHGTDQRTRNMWHRSPPRGERSNRTKHRFAHCGYSPVPFTENNNGPIPHFFGKSGPCSAVRGVDRGRSFVWRPSLPPPALKWKKLCRSNLTTRNFSKRKASVSLSCRHVTTKSKNALSIVLYPKVCELISRHSSIMLSHTNFFIWNFQSKLPNKFGNP